MDYRCSTRRAIQREERGVSSKAGAEAFRVSRKDDHLPLPKAPSHFVHSYPIFMFQVVLGSFIFRRFDLNLKRLRLYYETGLST